MSYSAIAIFSGIITAALVLRIFWPNRQTAIVFAVTSVAMFGYLFYQHGDQIAQNAMLDQAHLTNFVSANLQSHPEHIWPPQLGQPYPDLELIDQEGKRTSLSEFQGKVILLEPVGMPCQACVALAGGQQHGAFQGVPPQADLKSIEHYARRLGHVDLNRDDIVTVQVVFYNHRMTAPTAEDARAWAKHFNQQRSRNQIVLAAEPYLVRPETRNMIPGFQLIDKNFVLRYDSTGYSPRNDLYRELLPAIRHLCNEQR